MKKISSLKKMMIAATLAMTTVSFSASAKTITFGMEASFAPFEYYDDNNLIGFDVDIAKEICKTLEAECKFTNQAFDSLIPSLKTRRIDAVISGMDITPERSKQVNFTQSYYDNSATFVVVTDKFTDVEALNGKRIGLQNGTTHQRYVLNTYPEMQVISYDSYQNAVLDLKSGRIDAIFSDTAVANEWLDKDNILSLIGEPIVDPEYFGSGFGIAIRQGNEKLLREFNQALNTMKENGTYKIIYQKWFG